MTRTQWYWTIQITGWTLYAILGIVIVHAFDSSPVAALVAPFSSAVLMLLSTHQLRRFLKAQNWPVKPTWILILKALGMILIAAALINLINSVILIEIAHFFTWQEYSLPALFLYILQTTIYFLLWMGAYTIILYFRNYRQQEVEKWKLESSVKEAELLVLKAQINPHFLFNALNNIRALVLEDPDKSRDMITHLAELFRYSISYNNQERVRLKEEIEMVRNYIALESIHYEGRLQFSMNIDPGLYEEQIPPMVIQLMVENAVKHGISQNPGGGEIELLAERIEGGLHLMVSNTGRLQPTGERSGIGLNNALERIRLIAGKDPEFRLEQHGERVESHMTIPELS